MSPQDRRIACHIAAGIIAVGIVLAILAAQHWGSMGGGR